MWDVRCDRVRLLAYMLLKEIRDYVLFSCVRGFLALLIVYVCVSIYLGRE